jgi:integrase
MINIEDSQQHIQSIINLKKPTKRSFGNGLYLKVHQNGSASWIFRYKFGKDRKEIVIGDALIANKQNQSIFEHIHLNYEDALLQALQYKSILKKNNIDPQTTSVQTDSRFETLNDVANDYFANECNEIKFPEIPARKYEKYVKNTIGKMLIADITTRMILDLLRQIKDQGKPTIANDALQMLKSAIFPHVAILGLTPHNPAQVLTNKNAGGKERSRKRYLNLEEIGIVLQVLKQHPQYFSHPNYLAVVLLIIFGCRKMELLSAMWNDIDLEKKTWLIHVSKQAKGNFYEVDVPIPEAVLPIFQQLKVLAHGSKYLFPARKGDPLHSFVCENTLNSALNKMFGCNATKTKKAIPDFLGSAGIKHFVVHDLRRTCKTLMISNGISEFVSERCINHQIKGIEGVYNRHDYFEERKAAFKQIADIIMPLAKIEKSEF